VKHSANVFWYSLAAPDSGCRMDQASSEISHNCKRKENETSIAMSLDCNSKP